MTEQTVVVGSPESYFADDVVGVCAQCGVTVYNRPHTPPEPPRVCLACYLRTAAPGDTVLVTEDTLRELRALAALTDHES